MKIDLHSVRVHAVFVKAAVDLAEQAGSVAPSPGEQIVQVQDWHAQALQQLAAAAGFNTVGLEEVLLGDFDRARDEFWAEEFEAREDKLPAETAQ